MPLLVKVLGLHHVSMEQQLVSEPERFASSAPDVGASREGLAVGCLRIQRRLLALRRS